MGETPHADKAPSPLPPPPQPYPLTADQWSIFAAIADTVIPSFAIRNVDGTDKPFNELLRYPLRHDSYNAARSRLDAAISPTTEHDGLVDKYLGERATDQPEFKDTIMRLIAWYMPEDTKKGIVFILDALNTRVGALLLTGQLTQFDRLPVEAREQIFAGWAKARLPLLKKLHRVLSSLIEVVWLRTSATAGHMLDFPHQASHPPPVSAWYPFEFVQFHDTPPKPPSPEANTLSDKSNHNGTIQSNNQLSPVDRLVSSWGPGRIPLITQLRYTLALLVQTSWAKVSSLAGLIFGRSNYDASSNAPPALEGDVVIVGSGCAGAVAAKTLAEAGLDVVVVDKGYYWSPKHLPMCELDAVGHLYGNGGAFQTEDASLVMLNGASWGGGGTINWSASLPTQGYVRREWSEKFGLPHFTSADFQADIDAVCDRMGVGLSAVEHNKTNEVLLEGARKLGWSAKPVPQNTGGEAHNCGHCTLGCGSCGKKGPTESFLPDAGRAGARFVEGFECKEVLFDKANAKGKRTAVGVRGTWTSRDGNGGVAGADRTSHEIVLKAKHVLLAPGALVTPLLLRRSGIRNPHLGRHLHLHPVSIVGAIWDEEVKPWEGSILTAVVNEFENLDGDGYGPKLEANVMMPSTFLPAFPWHNGLRWKEFVPKMKRMTGYISLTRDRYGGRVFPDPVDGRPRIAYSPSEYDRKHILEGVARIAEILYVEGAREIHTGVPGLPPFIRPGSPLVSVNNNNGGNTDNTTAPHQAKPPPCSNDPPFQAWLAQLRSLGFPSPQSAFASAHQMGTCRMGKNAKEGVVDPKGRVWDTQGLSICDTSVFPCASGANPMITCMAIARGVARAVIEDMKGGAV